VEENKAYVEIITKWLESQDFRIMRFRNNEVSSNLEGVFTQIEEALQRHPYPGLLPSNSGGIKIRDRESASIK
jgi:hypothetical protein